LEQKKLYRKGFVLGKFLPPHKGHQFMIESALAYVDELTILVCTIKSEPIAGELRYQWMKQLYPNLNVKHITDEVPSYPHEHPDFWNIWTKLLKRETDSDTELFFSSEDYGAEVAERLNIKHILIDKERKAVPISASAVRNQPFANWDYIPENVRSHFVKKIVLTGPESTGKTVMAKLLANHYQTCWVEEYGRKYFVNKSAKLEFQDIIKIAEGQIKSEDEGLKIANKVLFCDTDLIVTQIWSEIYFKHCPQEVIELNKHRIYDLYLLMDIDIPWEDDGTREFPHLRQWHFNRLKEELTNRKLPFLIISGNYEERLKMCVSLIDEFQAAGQA
jgi:HTH-type transcriptional repressor of NAD biosynthesis genes